MWEDIEGTYFQSTLETQCLQHFPAHTQVPCHRQSIESEYHTEVSTVQARTKEKQSGEGPCPSVVREAVYRLRYEHSEKEGLH